MINFLFVVYVLLLFRVLQQGKSNLDVKKGHKGHEKDRLIEEDGMCSGNVIYNDCGLLVKKKRSSLYR